MSRGFAIFLFPSCKKAVRRDELLSCILSCLLLVDQGIGGLGTVVILDDELDLIVMPNSSMEALELGILTVDLHIEGDGIQDGLLCVVEDERALDLLGTVGLDDLEHTDLVGLVHRGIGSDASALQSSGIIAAVLAVIGIVAGVVTAGSLVAGIGLGGVAGHEGRSQAQDESQQQIFSL